MRQRHKQTLALLTFLIIIVTTPTILAQNSGVQLKATLLALTTDQGQYPLSTHLEILEDQTKNLTIDQVSSPPYSTQFVPNTAEDLNLGISDSAYWVRFRVKDSATEDIQWLLEISNASINFVDAYTAILSDLSTDPTYIAKTPVGSLRPFSNREIDHRYFIYKLPLSSSDVMDVYLRFESEGFLRLPLTVWNADEFASVGRQDQFYWGFFYGILAIMVGYNFFLFLSLKDRSYLYLGLFILVQILVRSTLDGRILQYVSFGSGNSFISFSLMLGGLAFFTGLQFTASFLDTKQRIPQIHRIVRVLQGIAVLFTLLIPFFRPTVIIAVWLLYVPVFFVLVLYTAARIWRGGFFPARNILIAFSTQAAFAITNTLIRLELIPTPDTFERIEPVGVLLTVLLLSLALADRINLLRANAEEANLHLTESQHQLTDLLQERENLLTGEKHQRVIAETLGDVTIALTSKTDLREILDEILHQAQRLSAYSAAHIVLLDGDVLRISHWLGYKEFGNEAFIANLVQPIDDFPLDFEVMEKGHPLIYSDTHNDPKWVVVEETAWIRSHLSMPIMLQDRVLGLLRLDGAEAGQFTPEEAEQLSPLVSAAAIALENARLLMEEQQRSQALAVAHDQALQASHLKSELLAKVSHEFRTPLGAILGFSQILRKEVYGDLNEKQHSINAEVIDSTKYLTNLVNELLDQAQLEAGHLRISPSNVSLKRVLREVEEKMSVLARVKSLSLTTQLDPDLPDMVVVDPKRLQQILFNLVGNAIKFTDKGGVDVRFRQSGSETWTIEVKDSGIGIPKEDQGQIFDPFYQVDGSDMRLQDGTGLGLSIVHQLVTLMEGNVQVESVLGQGSTFTITLPIKIEQEKIHA